MCPIPFNEHKLQLQRWVLRAQGQMVPFGIKALPQGTSRGPSVRPAERRVAPITPALLRLGLQPGWGPCLQVFSVQTRSWHSRRWALGTSPSLILLHRRLRTRLLRAPGVLGVDVQQNKDRQQWPFQQQPGSPSVTTQPSPRRYTPQKKDRDCTQVAAAAPSQSLTCSLKTRVSLQLTQRFPGGEYGLSESLQGAVRPHRRMPPRWWPSVTDEETDATKVHRMSPPWSPRVAWSDACSQQPRPRSPAARAGAPRAKTLPTAPQNVSCVILGGGKVIGDGNFYFYAICYFPTFCIKNYGLWVGGRGQREREREKEPFLKAAGPGSMSNSEKYLLFTLWILELFRKLQCKALELKYHSVRSQL